MEIIWNKNHTQIGVPTLPKIIQVNIHGKNVILTKTEITRCVEFLRTDLGITGNLHTYGIYTSDNRLGLHFIIDSQNKTLFVPPAALVTHTSLPGGGSVLQQILEEVTAKNNYKLVVCIAASEITGFSQRVVDSLEKHDTTSLNLFEKNEIEYMENTNEVMMEVDSKSYE